MTARLSLLDSSEQQESPWADHERSHDSSHERSYGPSHEISHDPSHEPFHDPFHEPFPEPPHAGGAIRPLSVDPPHDPSPWGSQHSIKISAPQEIYLQAGQSNPYAPALVVDGPADDSFGLQPPHTTGRLGSDASFNTPSMISTATSATSHELIDLEIPGAALGEVPRLPPRDVTLPPLPSRKLSPIEAARQQEQRAETYSIRQINWTNREGTLLQSPILVQNKNGPCPLLALINALVLRADDPNAQPPIVRALKTREQISLGLLIEALFEELTTCLGPDDEFPDIEALAQFLTMLHTGMNVNPRLTLVSVTALSILIR